MIRFDRVYKAYSGAQDALKNISLEIDEGEFVFLTGHSGAGKSTLLRLIALIDRATHGQVIVDGRNLDRVPRRQIPYFRRRIGFIFQEHRLLPERSVFDNVALPLVVAGLRSAETQKRVRAALDKVGLLNKERASPRSLSSGEQQRVGIARAVVNRPRILLADEPTGNLDPGLSLDILKLFSQFNDVGVTVLIATHDLELIRQQQRRRIALVAGRICAAG
ncbi:MAG: cell division ATP-binding protein FtsE [Proteobacteria bacterium]|nr:MAG: cell division ATP-binding protein FtsE [Pseudomonadota bacterium]